MSVGLSVYFSACLSAYMFESSFWPNQVVTFSETWHDGRF